MLRVFLLTAPDRVLVATDASNFPGVPVGPEVQHFALSRTTREALYLALAGLVRDDVVNVGQAVAIRRGVFKENARRLYRWPVNAGD